jgi:8-oxo-dGTP pyrophosphatase MutT (NUDIX family)/2'-5' RNA ligase
VPATAPPTAAPPSVPLRTGNKFPIPRRLGASNREGIITAIVAVTGAVDDVNDLIVPGAFAATLARRRPKVTHHHDWTQDIGRVLHIEEWRPGDRRLPARTPAGKPWPAAAGALVATTQFNLDVQRGREAFEMARFYADSGEGAWSIGYKVVPSRAVKRGGIRVIYELELYEVSTVLHGAHPLTMTLEVKDAQGGGALETKPVRSGAEPLIGTGVMVALVPPPDVARSVEHPNGTPAAHLHMTLAYLGTTDDLDVDVVALAKRLRGVGDGPLSGSIGGVGVFPPADPPGPEPARAPREKTGPTVAGMCVLAADTGRVLMLQRALNPTRCPGCGTTVLWDDQDECWLHGDGSIGCHNDSGHQVDEFLRDPADPAAGRWEFPGGHAEHGENLLTAAAREFAEETGVPLQAGQGRPGWDASNGVYRGYICVVPSEETVPVNLDAEDRPVTNPDDPDGDQIETLAWWEPGHLRDNPAVRPELAKDIESVLAAVASAKTSGPALGPPVWVPVDVPGLAELRCRLAEALAAAGYPAKNNHGFIPHLTLGYGLVDVPVVPRTPVDFDVMWLVAGPQRIPIPLSPGRQTKSAADLVVEAKSGGVACPMCGGVGEDALGEPVPGRECPACDGGGSFNLQEPEDVRDLEAATRNRASMEAKQMHSGSGGSVAVPAMAPVKRRRRGCGKAAKLVAAAVDTPPPLPGKGGGADRNRGGAENLRRYYTHGAGAALIGWGTSGDHARCVAIASQHMSVDDAHGYCQLREHEVTGEYTAQHAARERAATGKKEVKSMPTMAGSQEERAEQLRTGVQELLYPVAERDEVNEVPWVSIEGTYPDHVFARGAYEGREVTWHIPYSFDGGQVSLGEPTEVELTVVAVPDNEDTFAEVTGDAGQVARFVVPAMESLAAATAALKSTGLQGKALQRVVRSGVLGLLDAIAVKGVDVSDMVLGDDQDDDPRGDEPPPAPAPSLPATEPAGPVSADDTGDEGDMEEKVLLDPTAIYQELAALKA